MIIFAAVSSCLLRVLLADQPAPAVRVAEVPPPLARVTIDDPFWSPRLAQWRDVTLPDVLNKLEKDGALRNFEAVRDGRKIKHGGPPWEDGLLYETMRAAADFLAVVPDPGLDARLDRIIALIAAAQARSGDGYINTWTQLQEVPDRRWGLNGGNDVWQHDIYNAGALVEAAVHHTRATGKTSLLEVALKMVDRMRADLGPPPRHPMIPGHALAEMALVELNQLLRDDPALAGRTGMAGRADEPLRLAEYFIEARGRHEGRKSFGAYDQDHEPALRQSTAEGHAVRATLFYAGLVDAGLTADRPDYLAAADRIWANMDGRRSHVTGGVGAHAKEERFGRDDELPSDAYLETCASVGAAAFHRGMLRAHADARYADALERTLYNGTLGGVGADGHSYFYVNPLRGGRDVRRWDWHECPCCPPMFLKQMAMLPAEIVATGPDTLYVNQFIGSRARLEVGAAPVELRLASRYTEDGSVRIGVHPERPRRFTLAVRVPGWCRPPTEDALYRADASPDAGPRLTLNGRPIPAPPIVRGYARIEREWRPGDVVEVAFPLVPARSAPIPACATSPARWPCARPDPLPLRGDRQRRHGRDDSPAGGRTDPGRRPPRLPRRPAGPRGPGRRPPPRGDPLLRPGQPRADGLHRLGPRGGLAVIDPDARSASCPTTSPSGPARSGIPVRAPSRSPTSPSRERERPVLRTR